MTRPRKALLVVTVAVVIAAHVGLFTAGGKWRRAGVMIIVVDVVSGLFVAGAIREFRKLD